MGIGLIAPYREWPQSAHWALHAAGEVRSAIEQEIELASRVAYREDSVLLHAASALDQLSVTLRSAARQLRGLAAQQRAASDDSPHVARRGK
jgi:hypothetical protein